MGIDSWFGKKKKDPLEGLTPEQRASITTDRGKWDQKLKDAQAPTNALADENSKAVDAEIAKTNSEIEDLLKRSKEQL